MTGKFNLSSKIRLDNSYSGREVINIGFIKEFIRLLKEGHMKHTKDDYFLNVINKIAGVQLNGI